MLSIFATTEHISTIHEIIQLEDRLSELVSVYDVMEHAPSASDHSFVVNSRGLLQPIDWHNVSPPYLLSNPLPLEKDILLGLIFSRLGNGEKAWYYLKNKELLQFDIGMITRLQHGYQVDMNEFSLMLKTIDQQDDFEQYRIQHNTAVLRHYGYIEEAIEIEAVQDLYQVAIEKAPNPEYKAFTAKHFATFLLDADDLQQAEAVLTSTIQGAISEDAKFELKSVLTNIWMKKLTVPYDPFLVGELKNTLWEVLQNLEKNKRNAEAALLLVDAAHIANISESYTEALGYLSKAIKFFEEEELVELAGNAHYRKGTLLYTWAQNGNPQFFKPAVESYQQALKVFTKEATPRVFADIQHNLAVIFTDMPSDPKKKGIWAGVAVSSFSEALAFYTKAEYPYEYGMICNNYGNAFTKFPPAVLSDNFEKALFYYQQALEVRTADYPYERAITLLNFLEASWNVGNDSADFNENRYMDMLKKAEEVKTLVESPELVAEAQKHLSLLKELKQTVSK